MVIQLRPCVRSYNKPSFSPQLYLRFWRLGLAILTENADSCHIICLSRRILTISGKVMNFWRSSKAQKGSTGGSSWRKVSPGFSTWTSIGNFGFLLIQTSRKWRGDWSTSQKWWLLCFGIQLDCMWMISSSVSCLMATIEGPKRPDPQTFSTNGTPSRNCGSHSLSCSPRAQWPRLLVESIRRTRSAILQSAVVRDDRNCLNSFIRCRQLLFLKFFFQKSKQPKGTWADVGRMSWARGSFDSVKFQFQTDFSSIIASQVVHIDSQIEFQFLSAIRPSIEKVMVELLRGNNPG
jgi:hypothetical protein